VAGDPANVRAPDRDVEGSPATPQLSHRRCCPPRHVAGGSATHNSTSWTHPLVTEWSAAPVHRRCLTDCHRQRWSDDCRIPRPVPGCDSALGRVSTTAPQAREIPRPAPDACSAGTPQWGGAVREERPRPAIHFVVVQWRRPSMPDSSIRILRELHGTELSASISGRAVAESDAPIE